MGKTKNTIKTELLTISRANNGYVFTVEGKRFDKTGSWSFFSEVFIHTDLKKGFELILEDFFEVEKIEKPSEAQPNVLRKRGRGRPKKNGTMVSFLPRNRKID